MKLPQAFSKIRNKLMDRAKGLTPKSKRVLILSGAAVLCFILVLPFLHKPEAASQQVTTPTPAPVVTLERQPEQTQPKVEKTIQKSPEQGVSIKDLAAPLKGTQIRGTSKDVIWWTVFADYRQHTGVDLKAAVGSQVLAAGPGTVVELGTDPAYGKVMVIDHGNGLKTVYGQLDQIKVKLQDKVKSGQVLAKVGKAVGGEADLEPHLHYEIWQGNTISNGK